MAAKTIKIFLASSEELAEDRKAFGNFCRKINGILEKHNCGLKPLMWEDFNADYNLKRKQDEYNEKIKDSDIFIAMFKTVAGDFTVEEYNVAAESHSQNNILLYQKNLNGNESMQINLVNFRDKLKNQNTLRNYSNIDRIYVDVVDKLKDMVPEANLKTSEKNNFIIMDNIKIADNRKL